MLCTVLGSKDHEAFDWDSGNIHKSYLKHGITPNQAEEIFLDTHLLVSPDLKHQQNEKRYVGIGNTVEKKTLCVIFTYRAHLIRVISARAAHRKERDLYEKNK